MSYSLQPHRLHSPWNSPDQNTGVGSLSLLQRIFPTQGWNPSLLHCRRILYPLSHKGSPKILEWVAYLFSNRSSQPRNWTGVSCITGGFFTNWAIMLSTVTIQIRADTDNSNGANNKESVCQCRRYKRHRFHFWTRKIAWRRDGNPLQYSCLENPINRGVSQATVHRVTKSQTWLKQLSMHT